MEFSKILKSVFILQIAYETWGKLNEDKSNAILLFTGLSASSHAKSHEVKKTYGSLKLYNL